MQVVETLGVLDDGSQKGGFCGNGDDFRPRLTGNIAKAKSSISIFVIRES